QADPARRAGRQSRIERSEPDRLIQLVQGFINLVVPIRQVAVIVVVAFITAATVLADALGQSPALPALDTGAAVRTAAAVATNVALSPAGRTHCPFFNHRPPPETSSIAARS